MKIENLDFLMRNLLMVKRKVEESGFDEVFYELQNIEFKEELYRVGQEMFIISENDKHEKKRYVEFYLPIINEPSKLPNSDFEFIEEIKIKNCLLMRQADSEEDLSTVREKLAQYLAKHEKNHALTDTTICVMSQIYQDTLMDVYVPLKTKK